jgi:DNA-directed RNA polymerase specialized sigma24 family protein
MSFEEFAAARLASLLRYAMLLSGDREEARDIVQEVLARALVKWDRIAEVLGCRTGTVRSNASRALAALRIELDEPTANERILS